ncbi:hypothetical protein Q5P01_011246 [Channa striata]|uniref:Fibronectin type-III domain-containing protein n=1 Tax=Channa striata TaxID=64152 RepID=A0AA88SQH4_CHASR|nr:hypothetical protein Q5P01_011246 [Channa striata]
MRLFLPVLCALCAAQVRGIIDGACDRKDPPPGVLVLSPGSRLVMTCKGHVTVNGKTVNMARNNSNTNRRLSPSVAPPTTAGHDLNNEHTTDNTVSEVYNSNSEVTSVTGENGSAGDTDAESTASPTTHMVEPTSVSRVLKSDWEGEEVNRENDYKEGDDGRRTTQGLKHTPHWSWNRKRVGRGKRDWGEIRFDKKGAMLSLSSVRQMDSGNYTCHHRGRETFTLKVIVADPPEEPIVSCYKKSPSSKIRCEWLPKKPVTKLNTCYLIWNKRPEETFAHLQCSYSNNLSRYWCALDHNEDDLRKLHTAYLCVTSITGNATSPLFSFIPWNILKPDPPSSVNVQPVVGYERYMRVTWNSPVSWKSQDSYFKLIYELKYKPLEFSLSNEQTKPSNNLHSETITDLIPGVDYVIQVRTKEEYDGQWSDWSTPVIGRSWTAPSPSEDIYTTRSTDEDGSAYVTEGPELENPVEETVSHHVLWISGSFLLLVFILAAYVFRHKDRFMPKLHHLNVISQCSDSSQPPPSSPTAPEVQALVTFSPIHYKEPQQNGKEEGEEENEEEQKVKQRIEAMHFHNTSYFLFRRQ